MPNPTISFRLNKYQIARGLDIICRHVPDYKPSSISQIVKLCYLDYLAKMNQDNNLEISQSSAEKIKSLTTSTDPLDDIITQLNTSKDNTDMTKSTSKVSTDDVDNFFKNLD